VEEKQARSHRGAVWMEGMVMTNEEREELIQKMARALAQSHVNGLVYQDAASAALAVAEPVIREQCARMAEKRACMIDCCETTGVKIAVAIREGGNEDGKNN